ncbi:DUF3300 domain-containing protein [Opitutus terrae]|uniref:DUF3300 domain-containing protein n=1 Tax=Opitutus terrae (strain DSM 11246 / JCM 15787 / PB90-1) TaxID=452637 RepID=B1ZMZ8_OPITP|nr:DUF3300 domain-containing protein [Opitutus terrae]ACB76450.1 conserved hypothetical protein [Opitutus terrae PB90-1]
MKTLLCLLSGVCVVVTSGCVGVSPASAEAPVPVVVAPPPSQPGSLDELVAPIALYPDALVALILPASTVSSDVVLAARYLATDADRSEIDAQPWDTSVKGLAHYPDVVQWMDENLSWTQRLGEAYLDQPEEVMAAIQRDRSRARAAGILVDTEQQQVVVEDGAIRIIPARQDVIYVPRYDPQIVYIEQPMYFEPDPWITFGIGFGVGSWLAYDCDWHTRRIWIDHHRHAHWPDHYRHDWRNPRFPGRSGYVSRSGWEPWRPNPGRVPPPHRRHFDPGHRNIPHPTPIAGAPRRDRDFKGPRPERIDRPDHLRPTPGRSDEGRPGRERFGRERPRPDRTPEVARQPSQPQPTSQAERVAETPTARRGGPWRQGWGDAAATRGPRSPENRSIDNQRRERPRDNDARPAGGPSRPDVVRTPPQLHRPPPAMQRPAPAAAPAVPNQPPRQDFARSGHRPAPAAQPPRMQPPPPVARVQAAPPQMRSAPPSAAPQMRSSPPPAARMAAPAPRIERSAPPPAARADNSGGDRGQSGSRGGNGGGGRGRNDAER